MKKLFALLLALMMVFALVACDQGDTPSGSNTDNPGTSQGGQENPGTQGGEENNGKEWPIDKYNWTGSGKIRETEKMPTEQLYYIINIDTATLDELTAYIDALKAAGFTYGRVEGREEPATMYEETETGYNWCGHTADGWEIDVTLYKEQQQTADENYDVYKYVLQIGIWGN